MQGSGAARQAGYWRMREGLGLRTQEAPGARVRQWGRARARTQVSSDWQPDRPRLWRPGGSTEFLLGPPTRAVTWSVASTSQPKFRVFSAVAGGGAEGKSRFPWAAQPETSPAARRGPPAFGLPHGAWRGPARKGPRAGSPDGHCPFLSFLVPGSVSDLVAASLDLAPEAFPSSTPDNRTG